MRLTPLDPWIAAKIAQDGGQATRAAIEAYHLRKLRETLHLVREKSGFYRKHLATAPADLSCLADLARFPFTTAQEICEDALPFLCVSQGEIHRVVTLDSSGTTGRPKRLYFTRDDQELTIDFFQVGMSTMVGTGDCVLILLPGERPGSVGDLLAIGLGRLGVLGIKHGPVRDVAETLEAIAREGANALVGIPTQVLALARYRDDRGRPVSLKLKSVLLSTDHVPGAIAAAVEQAWGCEVYNHYGMTEMGLGGGVECQARRGYHLREADLYFEIVDPDTGQPLADGEEGEVVLTTLTRRGMPLVRYRTGDLSRFLPGRCPCGTGLKAMERIRDRITGQVAVGEGLQLSMADLDDVLFPIETVLDFSAAISREGGRNCLHLEVQAAPGTRDTTSVAIGRALDSVPAWRLAEHLDIALEILESNYQDLRSPIKRVLVDRRNRRTA